VADRTNPDISPVYGDLRGLPPVLLVVGSLDILLEDNLAMAARLSAAGGEVDVCVYPESPHGFTLHPTPIASAAIRDVESWLADCFIGPQPRRSIRAGSVVESETSGLVGTRTKPGSGWPTGYLAAARE
jgi:alpha/beta hydrolase family protein